MYETYTDDQGAERHDGCGELVNDCDCTCPNCGDRLDECACSVCGETYDHDLPPREPEDGMIVQICQTCGAEIITNLEEEA